MNGPSGSNAGLPATGGDPGDIQGGTAGAPPAGNNDALVPPGLHLGLPPGPPGGPPSNNGQTSDSAQQQARIAHLEAQLAAANGAAASGFNPDPGLWGGGGFGSAHSEQFGDHSEQFGRDSVHGRRSCQRAPWSLRRKTECSTKRWPAAL